MNVEETCELFSVVYSFYPTKEIEKIISDCNKILQGVGANSQLVKSLEKFEKELNDGPSGLRKMINFLKSDCRKFQVSRILGLLQKANNSSPDSRIESLISDFIPLQSNSNSSLQQHAQAIYNLNNLVDSFLINKELCDVLILFSQGA